MKKNQQMIGGKMIDLTPFDNNIDELSGRDISIG